MSRIYHYDTTYEQIGENDAVIGSAELRIFYTVTPAGGDDWNEPRYPAHAEFSRVFEIRHPHQFRELDQNNGLRTDPQEMADHTMFWWAVSFVEDHQDVLLIEATERDEGDADYAREMRDEMRREDRR